MKKIIFIFLFFSFLSFVNPSFAAKEATFFVIVNASNPDSVLTREEVARIFLKKIEEWESSGKEILPVDLTADSQIREDFSEEIHNRGVSTIKAFWYKKVFSGRASPPPLKKSDDEVLEYVDKNSGAIGYVSRSAKLSKYKVKALKIVEK